MKALHGRVEASLNFKAHHHVVKDTAEEDFQDITELNNIPGSSTNNYGSKSHLRAAGDSPAFFRSDPSLKTMTNNEITSPGDVADDTLGRDGVNSLPEKEKRLYELMEQMPKESNDISEYDIVFVLRLMYECLGMHIQRLHGLIHAVYEAVDFVYNRVSWVDCSDALKNGYKSGYYTFFMKHQGKRPITLLCDMETDGGGWTVVQRRQRNAKPRVIFNQGWYEYKTGFGNFTTEYWAGLENMHFLCGFRNCEMRVDLEDLDGNRAYAAYTNFYVDSEELGYKLNVDGYYGNAGDALAYDELYDRQPVFCAQDHLNKTHRFCAREMLSGWWYTSCTWSSINGLHLCRYCDQKGITWHTWPRPGLRTASIKIRPIKE